MAPTLRSHTQTERDTVQSTIQDAQFQWLQDLVLLEKNNLLDAPSELALRSARHPSCRVAKERCHGCSLWNKICFVTPAVSPKCVRCLGSKIGHPMLAVCSPVVFDGENDGDNDDSHDNDGDNDVEDVISMTADRRHKKRASSTAPAATNTIGVHAKKSEKPLENTGRRTKTSRLPSTNIVPAIVPRGSIMSEQKSSVRQQESTPSIRTTSLAKAGKLTLNGPKRRRLEIDTTSGAVQEAAMPESPVPCRPKMSIDANKQDQTTLWISLPSSTDAVPLMLRSCMTMTSLFDSVFKIWGLAEQQQQDKILGLRTTLGWTQSDGVRKRLMLKREFEDSFETFLRIIDASLCWEQEGGCCSVDIEAVMA